MSGSSHPSQLPTPEDHANELIASVVEQAISAIDPRYVQLFNTTVNLLEQPSSNTATATTPFNTPVTVTPSGVASRRLSRFILNSLSETTTTASNGEMTDVPVTLNEDLLNKIQVRYVYGEQGACSICLDEIKNEHAKELPCKHLFHTHCIDNWLLNEKVTCPMCRIDMREHIN